VSRGFFFYDNQPMFCANLWGAVVTVRGEVAVRDEKFVETVGQTLAATTRRVTS
jgi:hypothetical protein